MKGQRGGTRERLIEAAAELIAEGGYDRVGVLVRGAHARAEAAVAGVVEQAKADGDVAPDVDPAAVARFGTALSIGYHVLHTAGMPDPDGAAWVRLMTRVVASISAPSPPA